MSGRDESGDGAEPDPLKATAHPPVAQLIDRRGRARLVYEPIADLARGTICGYEALERFPGAIAPEAWRGEALRRGLEPDWDAFVVTSVLHARENLSDGCFLAFKVRPATLLREAVRRVLTRAARLEGPRGRARATDPQTRRAALRRLRGGAARGGRALRRRPHRRRGRRAAPRGAREAGTGEARCAAAPARAVRAGTADRRANGGYAGVVPFERLVEALAHAADRPSGPDS